LPYVKPSILSVTTVQDAADWIELRAIQQPERLVHFSDIRRMFDDEGDAGSSDYGHEDVADEDIWSQWVSELQERERALSEAYPFELTDTYIKIKPLTEHSWGGYAYLLCLFLSHPKDDDVIDGAKFLKLKKNDPARELFQIISTVAASGYLRGSSVSFGWPRKDHTLFVDAINRLCRIMFDASVFKRPPDLAAPTKIKDFEIDIVSWIPTNDKLPAKVIFVSQVASGANWKSKPLRNSIVANLWPWLEKPFASGSQVITSLFIPFCIYPANNESLAETLRYLCASDLNTLIFHRHRIPYYVQQVFTEELHIGKGLLIERTDDFPEVTAWVDEKMALLA